MYKYNCQNEYNKTRSSLVFMVKCFYDKYAKSKTFVRKQARTKMSTTAIVMFIPSLSYALDMLFNYVSNDKMTFVTNIL